MDNQDLRRYFEQLRDEHRKLILKQSGEDWRTEAPILDAINRAAAESNIVEIGQAVSKEASSEPIESLTTERGAESELEPDEELPRPAMTEQEAPPSPVPEPPKKPTANSPEPPKVEVKVGSDIVSQPEAPQQPPPAKPAEQGEPMKEPQTPKQAPPPEQPPQPEPSPQNEEPEPWSEVSLEIKQGSIPTAPIAVQPSPESKPAPSADALRQTQTEESRTSILPPRIAELKRAMEENGWAFEPIQQSQPATSDPIEQSRYQVPESWATPVSEERPAKAESQPPQQKTDKPQKSDAPRPQPSMPLPFFNPPMGASSFSPVVHLSPGQDTPPPMQPLERPTTRDLSMMAQYLASTEEDTNSMLANALERIVNAQLQLQMQINVINEILDRSIGL